MDIQGKTALVLGGAGLVGTAVCRQLISHKPARLVVAARREVRADEAAARLEAELASQDTSIVPVWGDVFVRGEWRQDGAGGREKIVADIHKRRRMIADILDPLDEEIVESSLLAQIILGRAPGLDGAPAQIVVDCLNTATAVSYQNVYAVARDLADRAAMDTAAEGWQETVERLLTSLYVPQLVRHVQVLYEAMRRAGTVAYVKIGTSGTGGLGFNIPFTHGEERPSRLLLSKAAVAGAQTLLTFLMARTPDGPRIVKEVKPSALIGWREIGHGPIRRGGQEIAVYDCLPEQAVLVRDARNLVASGDFGENVGENLEGVYIDTGENGLYSAGEFIAITALGQMELVTPEEIARNVVAEILGGNTGRDVVAALDGAVMGPSFRGGYLRRAALNQLRDLEQEHGESVAFELLGPPRLSKLLFEAYLLKQACKNVAGILARSAEELARALEKQILADSRTRRRIISIGLPILLPDGERLLRGPVVKSRDAEHGWVDLTAENMDKWHKRLTNFRDAVQAEASDETSSRADLAAAAGRNWSAVDSSFDIGEIAAWIFTVEDRGARGKD